MKRTYQPPKFEIVEIGKSMILSGSGNVSQQEPVDGDTESPSGNPSGIWGN